MESLQGYALAAGTALLAGGINALAGGGTLLTFPALLAVMGPTEANMTSTLALFPGSLAGSWGFRKEIYQGRNWLLRLLPASVLGGIIGSLLLAWGSPEHFALLIPWLILTASVLFIIQPWVARGQGEEEKNPSWKVLLIASLCQFLVAVYGGYFGHSVVLAG